MNHKHTLSKEYYTAKHKIRRYWEAFQQSVVACKDRPDLAIEFEPKGSVWPKHKYVEEGI